MASSANDSASSTTNSTESGGVNLKKPNSNVNSSSNLQTERVVKSKLKIK